MKIYVFFIHTMIFIFFFLLQNNIAVWHLKFKLKTLGLPLFMHLIKLNYLEIFFFKHFIYSYNKFTINKLYAVLNNVIIIIINKINIIFDIKAFKY